jgi:hypothetical protein
VDILTLAKLITLVAHLVGESDDGKNYLSEEGPSKGSDCALTCDTDQFSTPTVLSQKSLSNSEGGNCSPQRVLYEWHDRLQRPYALTKVYLRDYDGTLDSQTKLPTCKSNSQEASRRVKRR